MERWGQIQATGDRNSDVAEKVSEENRDPGGVPALGWSGGEVSVLSGKRR